METEIVVCMSCLHENDEFRDFCEKCGAPISVTASFTPMGGIQTEGFAYRQATTNLSKPIVIIGIYLIFLPILLSMLVIIPVLIENGAPFGAIIIFGFFGTISFLMLLKTTKNYIKNKSNQRMHLIASSLAQGDAGR